MENYIKIKRKSLKELLILLRTIAYTEQVNTYGHLTVNSIYNKIDLLENLLEE